MSAGPYDALLILSFGGPDGMPDVMPFLDNVLRGRGVPEERKREVAHHYELFGGVSPINPQNRQLQVALEAELERRGLDLPIYLGNRNWKPFVTDVIRQMQADGVKKFLTFVTSGFSCYSGCRQYREDLMKACAEMGEGAPAWDKIRVYYNHPLFIEVTKRHWKQACDRLPAELRAGAVTLFTAHSIPAGMAAGSHYEAQLKEAARLTAEAAGIASWKLVYQSRSGPPSQPWLEPDVGDAIRAVQAEGGRAVILVPIGFISDHMEVLFDLDREARELADEVGVTLVRASTPGTHPLFVQMIGELVCERVDPATPKRAVGARPPNHDVCPVDCCPSGRPAARPTPA
jgi:ferrochelatase